jgi:hypothetical protein
VQSTLNPDAALTELMDGNKRFTTGGLTAHEHDLAILKQNTIGKQEPFAAVLLKRLRKRMPGSRRRCWANLLQWSKDW